MWVDWHVADLPALRFTAVSASLTPTLESCHVVLCHYEAAPFWQVKFRTRFHSSRLDHVGIVPKAVSPLSNPKRKLRLSFAHGAGLRCVPSEDKMRRLFEHADLDASGSIDCVAPWPVWAERFRQNGA